MATSDLLSVGELTTAWAHYERRLATLDTMANDSVFTDSTPSLAELRAQRDGVARRLMHVERLLDDRLNFDHAV